jgi:hypothetical protein
MNEGQYNSASIVISVVSAVLAFLAILVSIASNRRAKKANKLANEANSIAGEALRLNKQQHAVEMRPIFTAEISRSVEYVENGDYFEVILSLKNEGNGTAILKEINIPTSIEILSPLVYPIEIHSNNSTLIRFRLQNQFEQAFVGLPHHKKGAQLTRRLRVIIHFADELNNSYLSELVVPKGELNFSGKTILVEPASR